MTLGPNAILVRTNDESLLRQDYILRFFESPIGQELIEKITSGTTQLKFNKTNFRELHIPVPRSEEQDRIVSKLDAAFGALREAEANLERNRANARELFASYLNGVFEGREGWREVTLEEIAKEDCTLSYGIVQPGDEVEDGLPIVRPVDLGDKVIKLDGLKRIDPKLANGYKRTQLQGGELLLCVRGDTGGISVASEKLVGANVTRGIVPIRFDSALRADFGYYLMTSPFVQCQIKEKTNGTALMQINIGDLRKIKLVYPKASEQERLVKELDAMDADTKHLETTYQQQLAGLGELKRSVLGAAFSGQL